MNPEILRQVASQHDRDARVQAERSRIARTLARALRAGRHGNTVVAEADGFDMPPVPDYIDGSFRGGRADESASSRPAA